jgi:FkbM family methyltransferase
MSGTRLGSRIIYGLAGFDLVDYIRRKYRRRWDLDFTIDVIRTIRDWPEVLVEDRAGETGLHTYHLRNGPRLLARPQTADRDVVLEVWGRHCYTPRGFEISPEDTVVDIGAHIGTFSIYASGRAKNGRVYALEPVPENFEMLKRNVETNNANNVLLFNAAVAQKKGTAEIFLSSANTGGHSLLSTFGGLPAKVSIKVNTVSLRDLMAENSLSRIDFLKMDCEGAEYDILYSCSEQDLKAIRRISMEYHDLDADRRNGKSLMSFLASQGFKVRMGSKRASLIYATRIDNSLES